VVIKLKTAMAKATNLNTFLSFIKPKFLNLNVGYFGCLLKIQISTLKFIIF
jgi:hypothetical protein